MNLPSGVHCTPLLDLYQQPERWWEAEDGLLQLCTVLFKDDLKYSPVLQHAHELTGKAAAVARTTWAGRIKNRLKV
jgi:hypothetical protein